MANGSVRANAATLLIGVFPLQSRDSSPQQVDELFQRQFDAFKVLSQFILSLSIFLQYMLWHDLSGMIQQRPCATQKVDTWLLDSTFRSCWRFQVSLSSTDPTSCNLWQTLAWRVKGSFRNVSLRWQNLVALDSVWCWSLDWTCHLLRLLLNEQLLMMLLNLSWEINILSHD